MADDQNFADHPESVGEIRAKKDWRATAWTPRDALIDMLRRIDNGEVKADAVVIVVREAIDEDGHRACRTHYAIAGADAHITLGLIERVKFQINSDAER